MDTYSNIKQYQQRVIMLVIFIIYCLFAKIAFAENENIEYKIKAGYLYNFTKFVYWPKKDTTTFNLCIVGTDPFGDLINPIEQKTALDKSIHLFRYSHLGGSFQHCDIIYFSTSVEIKILQKNTFDGILTIGEQDDFVRSGGMIGFVKKDNRIALQVNKHAIEKNRLKVSGKLLEIAEVIEASHE